MVVSMEKWSPIEEDISENEQILHEYRRTGILNVLGSYTELFDAFSELIQNALDAIDEESN